MDANATVVIHGSTYKRADLQAMIESFSKRQWRRQRWTRRDALVQRGSGMIVPYVGQPYDASEFEMVRGGWKRNLCEICGWELVESSDEQHGFGYTDGSRWLCSECHDRLLQT